MLHSLSSRTHRTLRNIAIGVLLPVILMVGTAAAAQPDAKLSITLSSGAETVARGDALTYTTEIRNSGGTVNARVVLAPPAYVTLGRAEDATVEDNTATWSVLLEGGSTTTLEIPARVAAIPDGELRVTTLASVYIGDATAPVVRTAVADHIEGVDDEQTIGPPIGTIILWAGIGIVLVLAAAAVTLLILRRRRATPVQPERDTPNSDDTA